MKQLIPLCLVLILSISCKDDSGLKGPLEVNEVNKIRHLETLRNSEISIRFDEVAEDSRCPANANCAWEGNAKIKFTLAMNKRRQIVPFELYVSKITHLEMKNDTIISDYRIEVIALQPYPESSDKIPQSDYIAEIRVEKRNSLSQN